MRTLSEIRRNVVSFYSSIQNKITDFSIGSVAGGIFYAFSASLERVYLELEEVRKQAYVATATGEYLDRLVEGTFQLARSPSTRAVGYVVVYGNSPLTNPSAVELRYADFNYETGEFTGGLQDSAKFVGFNLQGEEGVVFSLIAPRNSEVLLPHVDPTQTERLIHINRPVQFLILPVASVLRGAGNNIREGGIYSFPSPPPGLAGVLNTKNPGLIFFSSAQAVSGAPFFSRFTNIESYNDATGTLTVANAFNFSRSGAIEITGDRTRENSIVAVYSDASGLLRRTAGLIFEYSEATTTTITLSRPIGSALPFMRVLHNNQVVELALTSFSFRGVEHTNPTPASLLSFVLANISGGGLRIAQRPDQVSPELIFDPDGVLTQDYRLIDAAAVGGASDEDTDAQYRESLRKYLAGLARATGTALEAGTLQIPGVAFAKTLPGGMSPRGSATVLAADENGRLSGDMRRIIRENLNEDWKAAGINLIVRAPELTGINAILTMRVEVGTSQVAVYQQASATLEEYLKLVAPGGSVRYSDLLSAMERIGGVTNVFNMILLRFLTDETYIAHKARYDEAILSHVSSSGLLRITQPGHPFVARLPGGPPTMVRREGAIFFPENNIANATGILYQFIDQNTIEVLEGDVAVLYNLFVALVGRYQDAVTVSYLNSVLLSVFEHLGATTTARLYFLSRILGEPLEPLPAENYPVNPRLIDYRLVRDYTSSHVELLRSSVITIHAQPTPLVGIQFI